MVYDIDLTTLIIILCHVILLTSTDHHPWGRGIVSTPGKNMDLMRSTSRPDNTGIPVPQHGSASLRSSVGLGICIYIYLDVYIIYIFTSLYIWAKYNNSLTWIVQQFWDGFPFLPWFQWGRSEVVIIYTEYIYIYLCGLSKNVVYHLNSHWWISYGFVWKCGMPFQ